MRPSSRVCANGRTAAAVAGAVLALAGCVCVTPATARAAEMSADDPRAWMQALASGDPAAARVALAQAVEAGDPRFSGVLLELLRLSELRRYPEIPARDLASALAALTGERHGRDWHAWARWYGSTQLRAPAGFAGFKGALLVRIDPRIGALFADGAPARIRLEEVLWGGVAYEGIPALDRPKHVAAANASYLEPEDAVFGIALDGAARAYPLRILDWHEMANDEIAGVRFSLAYCTLCGAGIAYRGRVPDTATAKGATYDFGSSGLLYRSNKLMVDRQTHTLWNQFTGRPVVGPLASGDLRLERLPIDLTTWARWRERHPHTRVLDIDTGFERPYAPGAAYGSYFASPETMFPVVLRSKLLPAKARVFGLEVDGVPKAYAIDALVAAQLVNDTLGASPIVVLANRGTIRVVGESLHIGPVTYSAGAEVTAYARGQHHFSAAADPDELRDETGQRWRVTATALEANSGERLERIEGTHAFWFAWNSFHPKSLVLASEGAANDPATRPRAR